MTSSETKASYSVNRHQVLQALKVLYPEEIHGWIELRCVPKDRSSPLRHWIQWCGYPYMEQARDAIVDYLEKQGVGGTSNVYVGRSLRDESGGGAARDVSCVQAVTLDIDPVRADRERPATQEEVSGCSGEAEQVSATVARRYGAGAYVVNTGNGVQLWYRLDRPVDVKGRRRWWESGQRAFESECRELVDQSTATMDTQWDLPRVVKLPGTWSVKGEPDADHPHRMAAIQPVGYNLRVELSASRMMLLAGNELDAEPKVQTDPAKTVPSRFWLMLARNDRLQQAWMGKLTDLPDKSPSAQDMALACILHGYRFSPEDAMAILRESPGGNPKKRDRDDYIRLTVQKAYSK